MNHRSKVLIHVFLADDRPAIDEPQEYCRLNFNQSIEWRETLSGETVRKKCPNNPVVGKTNFANIETISSSKDFLLILRIMTTSI